MDTHKSVETDQNQPAGTSRHMLLRLQKCTGRLSHIQRHKLPSGTAALEPARFCCAQRTMFSPDGSAALRSLVRANPMCCTAHPKTEADGSNHHLEGSCFQFIDHICHLIKTESWISWISQVPWEPMDIEYSSRNRALPQHNVAASRN